MKQKRAKGKEIRRAETPMTYYTVKKKPSHEVEPTPTINYSSTSHL